MPAARWRLRNSLELLRQQRQAVKELANRGLYPTLKVVQVERQYSDDEGELAKARAMLDAAEAAEAEAESRLQGLETERRSEILTALSDRLLSATAWPSSYGPKRRSSPASR